MRALLAIVGLILAVLGLGLAALGLLTLLTALAGSFPLEVAIGTLGLTAGVATLFWSVRLILGRPRPEGGLLSPWTLRVVAVVYVGLPVAALVFGTWRDGRRSLAGVLVQAGLYFVIAWFLWQLARNRSSIRSAQERAIARLPGTTVGDFEAAYGPGELYDDHPRGNPWQEEEELSIVYFDPKTAKSFVVGVHSGPMSVAELKADRKLLAECRAEVINPPPDALEP